MEKRKRRNKPEPMWNLHCVVCGREFDGSASGADLNRHLVAAHEVGSQSAFRMVGNALAAARAEMERDRDAIRRANAAARKTAA